MEIPLKNQRFSNSFFAFSYKSFKQKRYAEWKKLGYDKHFYAEHEQEIIIHKAAKKAFDAIPGKIPTIKALSAEYSEVLTQKQAAYAHYRETRDSMRELLTVKANIDMVTNRHMPAKSIRNREVKR